MKLIDSTSGESFELMPGKTFVGRAADNTVQINNPSVSGHHCEITVGGQRVVIKDLQSTNGTFVNGEPVSEAVCDPGSVLRLGEVELILKADEYFHAAHSEAPSVQASTRKHVERMVSSPGSTLDASRSSSVETDIRRRAERSAQSDRRRIVGFWIMAVCGIIVVLLYWKVPMTHEGGGRGSGGRLLLPPLLGAVYGLFQLITGIHIFEPERLHEMPVIKSVAVVMVFFVCLAIVILAFIALVVSAP